MLLHGISGLTTSVNGHLKSPVLQAGTEALVPFTECTRTSLGCAGACMVLTSRSLQVSAVFTFVAVTVRQQPLLTLLPPADLSGKAHAESELHRDRQRWSLTERGRGRKERREGAHMLNLP